MTRKQFDLAKKQLDEEMNAHGYGWINGKYTKPPQKYKLREEELSCISMIDSILAYGGFGFSAERVMQNEENRYHNYLADYVEIFGRDKVVALIQGQIDSIERIESCVYTDGEGVTYNSIIWKE